MNREAAAQVRLLVLDVDGVLTDGRLLRRRGGKPKSFHVRDGYGIQQVLAAGLLVAVISGRRSEPPRPGSRNCGCPTSFWAGTTSAKVLRPAAGGTRRPLQASVACVGDDVTDLAIMGPAGLGITVADAHPDVLRAADWVTAAGGGGGAVREVCDLLLASRQPA